MAWRKCEVWNCDHWHVRVFPSYCDKHDMCITDFVGVYNTLLQFDDIDVISSGTFFHLCNFNDNDETFDEFYWVEV